MSRTNRALRDGGLTLVELIVVVATLGLVTAVVASAVTTIVRNEDGISRVTARSHDTQQLTNYFPSDVQTGPIFRSSYVVPADGATGSGCSDSGTDNVLRYDVAGRRIAYQLVVGSGSVGELERYECTSSGSLVDQINLADEIDLTAASPIDVSFDLDGTSVDRVVFRYAQVGGSVEEITGTPRAESGITPASSFGDCPSDPLSATAGFHAFSEGNVNLQGAAKVLGALAVGGTLTFGDGTSVGQDWANSDPAFDPSSVRMYLTDVDWTASDGRLSQNVGDTRVQMDPSEYSVDPPPGQVRLLPPSGGNDPEIRLDNSGVGIVPPGTVIDFSEAFDTLRSCAALISFLPDSSLCATCEHANLWDHNSTYPTPLEYLGVSDPSGYQVKIELDPSNDGGPTVVNLDADQLAAIDQISYFGPNRPSDTSPLIFNVANPSSGSTVTFDVPQIELQGDHTTQIFWNFFEADLVQIDRTLTGASDETVFGTVFAPNGDVVSVEKIWGGVVAVDYTQTGATVNSSRTFEGTIPWNP